ncbi:LmeA family phospholipid-binding protein [Kineococcus xinjiangensis]|uniref:LmeA family phospholipid-binding protein n=1 Tax=Kineococcus xinjiangensis TaxID=512762 RepID=UPI001304EFF9|nr:DUF2993 domain-containing protein [Kineococcus xinjiangensis]
MLLAVLVVGAVVADRIARTRAAEAVAAEVQREAGLPSAPEVVFPGGSFLWQAARGSFDFITVTAAEAEREGITGRDVSVRLEDVQVERDVLLGRGGAISAAGGSARALVPYSSLEERVERDWRKVAISQAGSEVEVTGEFTVLGREQSLSVVLAVELDGSTLVLTPTAASVPGRELDLDALRRVADRFGIESPLDGVPVELRGLPPEVRPRTVTVTQQGLRVGADLQAMQVAVPPR